MLIFIKLGGSLITDKTIEHAFQEEIALRLAREIRRALDDNPRLQLLIGHGSGSFGHVEANRYKTISGVTTPEQWRGFARVAFVASQLNYFVAQALDQAGVPVFRLQPSATIIASNGRVKSWSITPIQRAIAQGLVPLIYGDVSFDDDIGGTILSTETLLAYLVPLLPVQRIYLLGREDGVYDDTGTVIPHINQKNYDQMYQYLGNSYGVDVTGGMLSKVRDMTALASQQSTLQIRIFNGLIAGLLYETLLERAFPGTLITV